LQLAEGLLFQGGKVGHGISRLVGAGFPRPVRFRDGVRPKGGETPPLRNPPPRRIHFDPGGRLARASSTILVKAFASSMASVASVLRSSSTRARCRPAMSWP